ncbi:hypothetical protein PSPO_a1831 [Pseudoalteromonas spongiae UST010723-006]|nr:hypothetical protein PSPO_a1831 [Pseudoalteromonas spongiae UST010723-006]
MKNRAHAYLIYYTGIVRAKRSKDCVENQNINPLSIKSSA